MVLLNYATKEIVAKIVYYGPALCGKTTNLQLVYTKLNPKKRGKMISLATEADRTLFFDFLPLELGTVQGFKVRFQLYTVPGQVFYGATRKLVLKGADAVVFVADSQTDVFDKNLESIEDMKQNLRENNLDPDAIPVVFQYNKRDLANIMTVEELNEKVNYRGTSYTEAVAVDGTGVVETFREITRLLIQDLKKKHAFMDTDKIKDLPPEIFEQKKAPIPEEEEVKYEIELGSYIRDGSTEEEEVVAGELLDQIETFSVNDYQEAEAFFDKVRKGSAAEAAIELSAAREEEIAIEPAHESVTAMREGERELTPEELDTAEPAPEVEIQRGFVAEPPPPPPMPSVEYMLGLDKPQAEPVETPRPAAPAPAPPPPPKPEPPQAQPVPAAPAAVQPPPPTAEPPRPQPAPAAQPLAAPVDLTPILLALERLEKAKPAPAPVAASAPAPAPGVDISPLVLALEKLREDVASLRREVSEIKDAQAAQMDMPAAPSGAELLAPILPQPVDMSGPLEKLKKELTGGMEGQDRLLLSILEAVREVKKANLDTHEAIESGLKYIADRLRDRPGEADKGGKKKWF